MKQPSAPDLYPELPVEDGQNYRLQMITDIEKRLNTERDVRKGLYKKYKRVFNILDWIGSFLGVSSMALGSAALAVPILLPILGTTSLACVGLATPITFIRRKLNSKSKKHYEIKTIADSKLNSIKNLISKSLTDGQLSESEFKIVLGEIEKFESMKGNVHIKHETIDDSERKKLIEEGKKLAKNEFKKKMENV